ncbi:hypothetical protein M9Y10_024276 [Tritrichomonas musculus]|uniref:Uncharacterized protein n=1 Tax=Tritrichomonas musculus TaxID=1915356 RepID=A0ABR2HET3_9EUKA
MLFYLLLLVLIKGEESITSSLDESIPSSLDESIPSTEGNTIPSTIEDTKNRTIRVVTFYDYEVEITNENDVLNIEVPNNTFILISSLDGYNASIYKSREVSEENYVQSVYPDPMNRLIYFKFEGLLIITSTKDSLKFKFHSLPIDKINTDKKLIQQLVVSTNTKETFNIYPSSYSGSKTYVNYTYGLGKIAVWFAKDQVTNTTVFSEPPKSIIHCAFPFDDPENDADISFTDIKPTTKTQICSKSKLFILDEKTSEKFPIFIDDKSNVKNNDDHYDNFRAAINSIDSNNDTVVIQRGKSDDRLRLREIYTMDIFKEGLSSLDFTLSNLYDIRSVKTSIFIFPLKEEISINKENDIFGIYVYNYKNIKIQSNNDQANLNTVDYKYIMLSYDSLDLEKKFIISTSPTEKLIIDESSNKNANYTNEINSYYYIMASLQDIETTVTFTGKITVTLIKTEKCETIEIESGDKIEGPFKIEIDKGTKCEFVTALKGELKPNCTDNARLDFKLASSSALFSSKYQCAYNTYDATESQYSVINMNIVDVMKITTYNIIYIHDQKGWKGEIDDPAYTKPEELQFGPHLNITAFYYISSGYYAVSTVDLIMHKLEHDASFSIHISTHSTQIIRSSNGYSCSDLVVFNEIPSYFHISTRRNLNNSIYISSSGMSSVCLFPVFKIYNIGYRINLSGIFEVTDPKSRIEPPTHSFNSDDYFDGKLTQFNHYSGDSFVLGLIQVSGYRKEADIFVQYIYQYLESEEDNGILPDEPKFYSKVPIYSYKGINVINNMKSQNDNKDDDDDDNTDDGTFVIDKQVNGQNTIDMSNRDSYTLKCPKSTIVHFHKIDRIIIEAYDADGNLFQELNKDSVDRFINFGKSDGEIKIKKSLSGAKNLLEDLQVTYSYLVRNSSPAKERCDSVFISNDYRSKYIIGGINYKGSVGKANITIGNGRSFCAWFTYPAKMKVQLFNQLFDNYIIYNNNTEVEKSVYPIIEGTNILFILLRATSSDYRAELTLILPENTDTSVFDQNPICEVVTPPSTNGPIKDENTGKPTTEYSEGDPTSKLAIILIVVISVVVVAIIVIVVVVCVIKKRKNRDRNSTDEDQP